MLAKDKTNKIFDAKNLGLELIRLSKKIFLCFKKTKKAREPFDSLAFKIEN